MGKRTAWDDIKAERPLSNEGLAAYEDEPESVPSGRWCTGSEPMRG